MCYNTVGQTCTCLVVHFSHFVYPQIFLLLTRVSFKTQVYLTIHNNLSHGMQQFTTDDSDN